MSRFIFLFCPIEQIFSHFTKIKLFLLDILTAGNFFSVSFFVKCG